MLAIMYSVSACGSVLHPVLKCPILLQWMNAILTEMWPFYDKAVCAMVKVGPRPLLHPYIGQCCLPPNHSFIEAFSGGKGPSQLLMLL